MQWLMKCCARGALGLGAAALLLSGIPAHAKAVSGPPDAQFRESQPRLLAQTTTQPTAAETVGKMPPGRTTEKNSNGKTTAAATITTEEDEDPGGDTGGGAGAASRPGTIWRRGYPG